MSQTIVSSRVAELIAFAKEKTISNVTELASGEDLNISQADLSKIVSMIDLSISQAFSLGYSNVEKSVNELITETVKSNT